MLNSSLCDYSDGYNFVKRTLPVPANATASPDRNVKHAIHKNFALFIGCISEISIVQVDNTKDWCINANIQLIGI